jgi:hypothetical protein
MHHWRPGYVSAQKFERIANPAAMAGRVWLARGGRVATARAAACGIP